MAPGPSRDVLHNECTVRDTTRTVRRALRVGFYAALARVALGLVKTVLLRRTLRARAVADAVLTLDPCKWACVLGGWALFPAVRAVVAAALRAAVDAAGAALAADGRSSSRRLAVAEAAAEHTATAVAGAAAALPVLVMNVTTRTELGLYLAARALHGAAVTYLLPALPEPLATFRYYDVAAIAYTGIQILYCLLFTPNAHSPGYLKFLRACTMLDKRQIEGHAGLHRGVLVPAALDFCEAKGIAPPRDGNDIAAAVRLTFPNATTGPDLASLAWMWRHFSTFCIPMYLPLKLLALATVSRRRLVADPAGSVFHAVKSAVMSSAFLTLYCVFPLRFLALAGQLRMQSPLLLSSMCGTSCIAPSFLEPHGRRLDLALYCVMHSIRSLRLVAYVNGYLSRPTRHQVLAMYVASVAFLFHQHTHTPETLHPNLEKGMRFLFGESRPGEGRSLVPTDVASGVQTALEDIQDEAVAEALEAAA